MIENSASNALLADWRALALAMEQSVKAVIVGLDRAIRLLCISTFSRGHVILEGNVGVGKTILLRAVARAIGGGYEH